LQSLSPNDFINFLVTELQNQDPLNPTSSDQMLSQLSQIGQLESSTQLQTDLSGMVEQNQVSSASSMIGKQVTGTDANNLPQQGNVTAVQVQNNTVNLTLDSGAIVPMANVTTITNGTTASATTSGTTSATPPS
jgi:flagellar basal-body rod modification protein FlgD